MQGQQKPAFRPFDAKKKKKFTELWHETRRLLVENDYGTRSNGEIHPRAAKLEKLVNKLGAKKILDAAVSTGMPALLDIERTSFMDSFYCSDGDNAALDFMKKNYLTGKRSELIARTRLSTWNTLHNAFKAPGIEFEADIRPGMQFDMIIIVGNSLGYSVTWGGGSATVEGMETALGASFAGIRNSLAANGKLVFDIANYGEGRKELGKGNVDGDVRNLFIEVDISNGKRIWTIGDGTDNYSLQGMDLDINAARFLMQEAKFSKVERLPDELQLDPGLYESYVASK